MFTVKSQSLELGKYNSSVAKTGVQFNKCSLSTYCVPHTVLSGPGNPMITKIMPVFKLHIEIIEKK